MAKTLEIGTKINYWEVIGPGSFPSRVLCRCICGTIREIVIRNLITNGSKSCGCKRVQSMREYRKMIITESDLIGYKFGRYTVIGRGNANNTKDERWLCKCDCGTERIIKRRDLVSGRSTSCGCGRRQHSPKDAAISSVFAAYKGGAKQRGIEFSLDKDVFAKLLLAECTYCGTVGGCVYNDKSPNHTSEWRQKKVLTYTGIDRIDSSKGYTVDNCCSCCLTCNKAKNTMSQEEFSLWVLRVLDWAQKVQESKEVKKHAKREIEDE